MIHKRAHIAIKLNVIAALSKCFCIILFNTICSLTAIIYLSREYACHTAGL